MCIPYAYCSARQAGVAVTRVTWPQLCSWPECMSAQLRKCWVALSTPPKTQVAELEAAMLIFAVCGLQLLR